MLPQANILKKDLGFFFYLRKELAYFEMQTKQLLIEVLDPP